MSKVPYEPTAPPPPSGPSFSMPQPQQHEPYYGQQQYNMPQPQYNPTPQQMPQYNPPHPQIPQYNAPQPQIPQYGLPQTQQNYGQQQPNVTILHQQGQNYENKGVYWDYLKTPSCILKMIITALLITCCIMMGRASLIDALFEISASAAYELYGYFTFLNNMRSYYLVSSSILLVLQVVKIGLNVANLGDYRPTPNKIFKVINIVLNIIEGLGHFALFGITITFSILGFYLYLDINFALAMSLVFPIEILRAVAGCVDCCCSKSRRNTQTQLQPVIIMQNNRL